MSEAEQNEMIGRLLKQKQEAQTARNLVDRKVKEIGEQLVLLGTKLKSTMPGGDCRDLFGFLEKAGVDTPRIADLVKERERLTAEVHELRGELAKLGISQE